MKTLDPNQAAKVYRTYLEPLYFAHIYLPGETLYLSNRTFKYNGHNYEALLLELPALAQSIEKLGGYQNLSGSLNFRNIRYRSAAALLDWLWSNPITRREMDLYVLYIDPGETFGSDISTKLARLAIGEIQGATDSSIVYNISSIMHFLDNKNIFTQINRTNWPNAAPDAIGKYEDLIYGFIRDVPCQWVLTGANSTLFLDMAVSGETYVTLSEVDWPIAFPSSGTIQIDGEKINYSAKDSVNKRLTISGRGAGGTTATAHRRGTTVIEVLSTYKCLVMGQIGKSIANVKCQGVRLNPANYTVNLNDGGKGTIAFTAAQIELLPGIISNSQVNPASHSHPVMTSYVWRPTSGINYYSGWSCSGDESTLRDQSDTTGVSASGGSGYCQLRQNLPAWPGGEVTAVYFCVTYYNITKPAGDVIVRNEIGATVGTLPVTAMVLTTSKFKVTRSTVPSYFDVYGYNNASMQIREMWLEVECDATGTTALTASTSSSFADKILALPLITCDVEGYQDDGSGTYTGTPNALIEVPSDIRKHLLIALYGRSSGEIGASFATARTAYVNRITGGYKFGMILSRLGLKASEIFKALDEQSRSNMREDGGKFELVFNDAASPTSALTIDKKIYVGKPVFKQTRAEELKNVIRATYDLDWSGISKDRKYGNYRRQTQRSNAVKITKYGELPLDVEYPAIQIPAMADDVADWALLQQKEVLWFVELVANRKARILEKGDWFTLNDVFASLTGLKWKVLSIEEVPYSQNYNLQALQYVAP